MMLGSLCAMLTVCIWSGWNIVTRMGTTEALLPGDITFLRFLLAGLIALPILYLYREKVCAVPLYVLLGMALGAGAPYVWTAGHGFQHAPAAHGVLIPGIMTVFVALLSRWFFQETLRPSRVAGYALIGVTVLWRLWSHSRGDWSLFLADSWFIAAGLLWAGYTVLNRRAGLPPLAAVAVVSVGSLVLFCVPYAALQYEHLQTLPLIPSLKQMAYQGIVVSFVALVSYNQAIVYIGASRASAFAALIPATTTLLAMPVLGEFPTLPDIVFVTLLSLGVLFATGLFARWVRA